MVLGSRFAGIDIDLSKVLFIATANDISNIQPALRDRMEMISISGYNIKEKVHIAKNHLFPKALNEHGVKDNIKISQAVLEYIIDSVISEFC